MNPLLIIEIMTAMTGLIEKMTPVVVEVMSSASSGDQQKITQAFNDLKARNDEIFDQTQSALR